MIVGQSIVKRMHAIDVRMQMEQSSGIPATAKDAFLAYCQSREQEQERSEVVATVREDVQWDVIWEDFGNWHDSPLF